MTCRRCTSFLGAIGCLCAGLVLASLSTAAGETPPDALVLLTVEGGMQLWWPEASWLINIDLPRRLGLEKPASFERVAAAPEDILALDPQGRGFSVLQRQVLGHLSVFGCGQLRHIHVGYGSFAYKATAVNRPHDRNLRNCPQTVMVKDVRDYPFARATASYSNQIPPCDRLRLDLVRRTHLETRRRFGQTPLTRITRDVYGQCRRLFGAWH